MTGRRAAFFDLDRTLVRVNTGRLYVRWRVRQGDMGLPDLLRMSWWTLRYSLGALDAESVARRAAATVAGRDEAGFGEACEAWVAEEVLPHLTQAARDEVTARQDAGYECALLTTSSRYVAEPVARAVGIEHVLSSQMEVRAGAFTGAIEDPLCYGPGKVVRARRWAEANDVELAASAFYTDSVSDLPMLEAVGEPRVVNPDLRLRRVARQRGWSIHTWT